MKKNMRRIAAMFVLLAVLLSGVSTVAFASGTKSLVTTGKCNMRKHPDKESKQIQTIPKGTNLKGTDSEYDDRGVKWYYCSYNGKQGWVSSKNLKTTESGNHYYSDADYKKYVVITGSCNVRKSPNLDGKKLGTTSEGKRYNCSGAQYDERGVVWYKIKFNGQSAWVSSKYSYTTNNAPIDYSGFYAAEYYVRVTASTLNMRKEPSTESAIVFTYLTDDVLYAVRTNGSWTQVLDEATGRSGYMATRWLEEEYSYEEQTNTKPAQVGTVSGKNVTLAELKELVPGATLIDAPSGSTNVQYNRVYVGSTAVAEIKFRQQGVDYTLRAAFCASEAKIGDIDGIDTFPTTEKAEKHIEMSIDGTQAVAHYYDATNFTQYALIGPAANNGTLVDYMSGQLFTMNAKTATLPDMVFFS